MVKIPPGIEDGKKLRIARKGEDSQWGGEPGDLYVVIKVIPHRIFVEMVRMSASLVAFA